MARRWVPRWPALLGCGCGMLLLSGILGTVWLMWPFIHPEATAVSLTVPTSKMPSPNAFDIYVGAAKSIRDEKSLAILSPSRTTSANSGAAMDIPAKGALLEKNVLPLRELRRAFNYEYMTPPCRSMEQSFKYLSGFRKLARLLRIESQVKAARGDWAGSVAASLDAVQFGEQMPRGGPLIHRLCGISIESIGRREAWKAIDHLTAAQARSSACRAENVGSRHIPFAETLLEEKWFGLGSLTEVMEGKAILDAPSGTPQNVKWPNYMRGAALNRYAATMDGYIEAVKKPYAAKPPLREPAKRLNPFLAIPDITCIIMLPVCDKGWFADENCVAQNALLTVTLALRAYKAEHGRYPERLADLAPGYLKSIPNDPFAIRGPLSYKRTGGKYILYSVGPDCKDDGGRAIDDPKANATSGSSDPVRRYAVQYESKGDIVVGVNTR
jgi:hypothetical protein